MLLACEEDEDKEDKLAMEYTPEEAVHRTYRGSLVVVHATPCSN